MALAFTGLSRAATRSLRRLVVDEVMELVDMLHEFPAFEALPEFDLLAVAGVCHRVELAADQVLARQGDEASSVFIVRKGQVRLSGRDANRLGQQKNGKRD